MHTFGPYYQMKASGQAYYPVRHSPQRPALRVSRTIRFLLLILATNFLTYHLFKSTTANASPGAVETSAELYLMPEARRYVFDSQAFEQKVRAVSQDLSIAPEWLMAVMYTESRFNPAAVNHKGSGATGLIQFMVPTVKELNRRLGTRYYMKDLKAMDAVSQLDLVYDYLLMVQERYGHFHSLTDLYLAILYPRAIGKGNCYLLFGKPSRRYQQNSGLDENGDGKITVCDIDDRMARVFPTAYAVQN